MEYKFFVDLDGVLADFDRHVLELLGRHPRSFKPKQELWDSLTHLIEVEGKKFFSGMHLMNDANELWEYVLPHKPQILTATGTTFTSAAEQKRKWVEKHLGEHIVVNTTTKSKHKAQFAAHNYILIDDRHKSINPWIEAGGIGILHTSAEETINQLKQLGL